MYKERERMINKARGYIKLGLYNEALSFANEITKRWPEHPSGWSYLGEIYGYYFGLGEEAAEAIIKGLQCDTVKDTVYWKPLCENAIHFARSTHDLDESIKRILQFHPKSPFVGLINDILKSCNSNLSKQVLFNFHETNAINAYKNNQHGFRASQLSMANLVIVKTDNIKKYNFLTFYQDALKDVDSFLHQKRKYFGLEYSPEDKLSLIERAKVLRLITDKYAVNDVKMHNRLAGTYLHLREYEKCISAADKAIDINKYDKPLSKKGDAYRELALKYACSETIGKAKEYITKSCDAYQEALSYSSDDPGVKKVIEGKLILSDFFKKIISRDEFITFPVDKDISDGIEKFYNEQKAIIYREFQNKLPAGLTAEIALSRALKRFNFENLEDVKKCTIELLEDMYAPFIYKFVELLKGQKRVYEDFTKELAKIASQPLNYGVMSIEAQMVLAFLVLNAKRDDQELYKSYSSCVQNLKHVVDNPSDLLSDCMLKTFGIQLGFSLSNFVLQNTIEKKEPDNKIIWWDTDIKLPDKSNGCFKLLSVIIALIALLIYIIYFR